MNRRSDRLSAAHPNVVALAGVLLVAGSGCSDPIEGFAAPPGAGGSGGAAGQGGATTSSAGGGATSTTSTTTGAGGGPGVPESLPFAVDDYFAPSGFMGDGAIDGKLAETSDCPMRAGEQAGLCHKLDYTTGSNGWAGIYWQYPDGNWGTEAGLPVPTDDAKVTFWAWSAQGGEAINFFAGGIGGGQAFSDTFQVEQAIVLTNTPTEYTLVIGTEPHAEIIGGFGWSADAAMSGSLVFYVDDIQYKASP